MTTIRAIVDGVDNATSAQMALTENMARDDLNPIEEARGCAALRDDFGMSLADIGRRVGRGDTAISHLIRLLKLPDSVLELIACGKLSEGHGRVLLSLPDHGDQASFAKRCAADGWSVRALERQVKAHKAPTPPRNRSPADQVEWLRHLRESLEPTCGASPVNIVARAHDRYQIVVDCQGSDELAAIVGRLRHNAPATTPTRSTDS
jgi:ParB family chromosome partitioning protein